MPNFSENTLQRPELARERPEREAESWPQALKTAIRDPRELCRELGLAPEAIGIQPGPAADFPLFVPRSFVSRMGYGNPSDPLLRQVLPLGEESVDVAGFVTDPVGDQAAKVVPGLLQKYQGRALLVTTGVCAIHCRYCFRRHFPYHESPRSLADWEPAIAQMAADPNLEEVILSGGDPLMIVDAQLAQLAQRLAQVPHLRRLRLHSRLPILIPQRVNNELLAWLTATRLTPIVVVHANHAAEIDQSVAAAFTRLVDAGIPVLNQAVLLRGVNDSVQELEQLCRTLVNLRVFPYYLHQLDRVRGAAHFEVPVDRGQQIIAELAKRLPGYAVPRYVVEVAGARSKIAIEFLQ